MGNCIVVDVAIRRTVLPSQFLVNSHKNTINLTRHLFVCQLCLILGIKIYVVCCCNLFNGILMQQDKPFFWRWQFLWFVLIFAKGKEFVIWQNIETVAILISWKIYLYTFPSNYHNFHTDTYIHACTYCINIAIRYK